MFSPLMEENKNQNPVNFRRSYTGQDMDCSNIRSYTCQDFSLCRAKYCWTNSLEEVGHFSNENHHRYPVSEKSKSL